MISKLDKLIKTTYPILKIMRQNPDQILPDVFTKLVRICL